MTSSQLVSELAGEHSLLKSHVQFTPESVYRAATLAQDLLLRTFLLLETVVPLKLVSGQQRYQFPTQTVTGGTAVTPARLTIPSHPFNTGDRVYVRNVSGLTGVNGERDVTKVDSNTISLDGTTGGGAWTSGGEVYHLLNAAISIPPEGIKISSGDSAGTVIVKRSKTVVELDGADITEALVCFWEELTEPVTIGFAGTPTEDTLVSVRFYRSLLPHEDVSSTTNPIVPSGRQMDRVLLLGTRAMMYEQLALRDARFAEDANVASQAFSAASQGYIRTANNRRRTQSNDTEFHMRW